MSTLELTPAQIKFFASINPDSIPADTVAVEIKHDGQTVRYTAEIREALKG